MADAALHGHDHDHEHKGFFTRWFMSTNHKDIGILYLFTGGLVGLISVIFTVYMRMELMYPGVQFMCLEGARCLHHQFQHQAAAAEFAAFLERHPSHPRAAEAITAAVIDTELARIVADYVAGMTDRYATDRHREICGTIA